MHGIAHSGLKGRVQIEGLEHLQNAQAEGKGLATRYALNFA